MEGVGRSEANLQVPYLNRRVMNPKNYNYDTSAPYSGLRTPSSVLAVGHAHWQ